MRPMTSIRCVFIEKATQKTLGGDCDVKATYNWREREFQVLVRKGSQWRAFSFPYRRSQFVCLGFIESMVRGLFPNGFKVVR